jgi:riboflavin synthase
MFSGIIEEVGVVRSLQDSVLTVECEMVLADLSLGDSVAVDGACLTAIQVTTEGFSVDLTPETMQRTKFGGVVYGVTRVNLERAVPVGGRFGGHICQGHIDGTSELLRVEVDGNSSLFTFSYPSMQQRMYFVEKGFVAIDGISLTVASCDTFSFTVSVIPFTLSNTTLEYLKSGDLVNIESDIIAKYIVSILPEGLRSQ